jgi:hypothetical protein
MTLTQTGSSLKGTTSFSGSPCFSAGDVVGAIAGSDGSGGITAGGIRVDFSATIALSRMNGTYNAVSAGACTGDVGTFSAVRAERAGAVPGGRGGVDDADE